MYSCRWIARLLGKIILITPAIGKALLYIRYLQRDPTKNLRQQHQNWEMTYSQSQESWKEMHWWLQRAAHLNGLPIILSQQPKESDVGIFDDAFDTGQGVTSRHVETADYRKEEETDLSINVKELKIIEFALQLHAREFEGALIKIFSDSIMALKYANKPEGTAIRGYKNLLWKFKKQSQSTIFRYSINKLKV